MMSSSDILELPSFHKQTVGLIPSDVRHGKNFTAGVHVTVLGFQHQNIVWVPVKEQRWYNECEVLLKA
jgi:hypothetical protein